MTIVIGWWAIPALITIAAFAWVFWPTRETGHGADIVGLIQFFAAIIVSLTAWLIWSLIA